MALKLDTEAEPYQILHSLMTEMEILTNRQRKLSLVFYYDINKIRQRKKEKRAAERDR